MDFINQLIDPKAILTLSASGALGFGLLTFIKSNFKKAVSFIKNFFSVTIEFNSEDINSNTFMLLNLFIEEQFKFIRKRKYKCGSTYKSRSKLVFISAYINASIFKYKDKYYLFKFEGTKENSEAFNEFDKYSITRFGFNSKNDIFELKKDIEEYFRTKETKNVYTINSVYGEWNIIKNIEDLCTKTYLPENQKQEILGDIQNFYNSEDWYKKRGLRYKRGYLFKGPPGTGKTSLVEEIAKFFNVDIYYFNINDISNLKTFIRSTNNINKKSIILFEDIDTINLEKRELDDPSVEKNKIKGRNREKDSKGLNLGDILNVVDGIISPENCIFIFTTNKSDSLDPALMRPGRIDKVFDITYMQKDVVIKYISDFFDEPIGSVEDLFDFEIKKLTPSSLQELCLDAKAKQLSYNNIIDSLKNYDKSNK